MAEELKPHRYHPSLLHMGDCSVCGNVASSPIHNTAGGAASESPEPSSCRLGSGGGGSGPSVIASGDAEFATECPACPYPTSLHDYHASPCDIAAMNARRAELEANLAAAHVRIISLEKNLDAWKSTAFNRYNEIEQQKARIAELEAAHNAKPTVAASPGDEERRSGHSKLVYDKAKRTIVTVRSPGDEGLTIEWLEGLAHRGGKGTVDNIDARALGRTATRLRSLAEELKIQDDANDILTRRIAELEAECARKGNDICIKSQRIAELEAADEKWRIGQQELEAWKKKYFAELDKPSVAKINYKDTTFADEQTRSLGFEPRMLQLEWRNNPPPYGQETAGRSWHWVCEQAIIDALIHEGIPAWHGDAVSCVAQIVEAYAKCATDKVYARVNRWCSALRKCQTFTPSLMDGEEAKERLKEINRYVYSVLGTGDTK